MMIRLTRAEMLREWKRRRGMLGTSTTTLELQRTDSNSVDEMVMAEIDDRYAELLATGPAELLPQRNMASGVEPEWNEDGSAEVELPAACIRILAVRMSGWRRPATIIADPESIRGRMQSNPYVRGRSSNPVAVQRGRRLTLYTPVDKEAKLTQLIGIAPPPDGSFMFDSSMWGVLTGG